MLHFLFVPSECASGMINVSTAFSCQVPTVPSPVARDKAEWKGSFFTLGSSWVFSMPASATRSATCFCRPSMRSPISSSGKLRRNQREMTIPGFQTWGPSPVGKPSSSGPGVSAFYWCVTMQRTAVHTCTQHTGGCALQQCPLRLQQRSIPLTLKCFLCARECCICCARDCFLSR